MTRTTPRMGSGFTSTPTARAADADLANAARWDRRRTGDISTNHNWTPHPSPDGKSIVIVSYNKDVKGHPANKDIALRILNVSDGKIRVLVNLIGRRGKRQRAQLGS